MRSRLLVACLRCAAVLLLGALAPSRATAVAIFESDDTPNVRAPATNPGWNNVGRVGSGSAVYLGNRWVITANHVGEGDLRLSDGRVMAEAVGSGIQLSNAGVFPFGSPDLRIFRLAEDPGLPAMSIDAAAPATGSQVMMIGAGTDRSPKLIGWRVTSSASGLAWSAQPLLESNVLGYNLGSTNTMRWGMNVVSAASNFNTTDFTQTFSTTFDFRGIPFEAQATPGDSGGGVFSYVDGQWDLSGLMIANQPLSNQPSNTITYGEQSTIVDLSAYRDQILSYLNKPDPLWQNQANYYDVSGNGTVTFGDVLILVNDILSNGVNGIHELSGSPTGTGHYLDVNGDDRVSTSDIQSVENQILKSRTATPAAAPLSEIAASPLSTSYLIPEPASGCLAAAAALLVGAWALRRRT